MPIQTPSPELSRAIVSPRVDLIDLSEEKFSGLKTQVELSINVHRERMAHLYPADMLAVRGGDESTRQLNLLILEVACQSAAFKLLHEDPHSDSTRWMQENSGNTPFVFRKIPLEIPSKEHGKVLSRSGVVICFSDMPIIDPSIHGEIIAEIGLALANLGAQNLYPKQWQGRAAFTG